MITRVLSAWQECPHCYGQKGNDDCVVCHGRGWFED